MDTQDVFDFIKEEDTEEFSRVKEEPTSFLDRMAEHELEGLIEQQEDRELVKSKEGVTTPDIVGVFVKEEDSDKMEVKEEPLSLLDIAVEEEFAKEQENEQLAKSDVYELPIVPSHIRQEMSNFDESAISVTDEQQAQQLCNGTAPLQYLTCPSYVSSTTQSKESSCQKKHALSRSVIDNRKHMQHKVFDNLDEFQGKLTFLDTKYWTVSRQKESLLICHIVHAPVPKILLAVRIDTNFVPFVSVDENEVHAIGEYTVPSNINSVSKLEELLTNLQKFDIKQHTPKSTNFIAVLHLVMSLLAVLREQACEHLCTLNFICEQLKLMTLSKVQYSSELMIFSSLMYSCFPQGYKLLRNSKNLILPGYTAIRRITLSKVPSPGSEQHDCNFLKYIKNRFKSLGENDKAVVLILDEIHLKADFDNDAEDAESPFDISNGATSAFVFMVNSLCSEFKDIVQIIPAKVMKAEILQFVMSQIIIGLEEIGFKIISVLTNNNAINREAISYFSSPPKLSIVYQHPADSSRPLFFMFDPVHLINCVKNDWLAQKSINKFMNFPQLNFEENHDKCLILKAPFTTLRKLYALEADSLLKNCYMLTQKSSSSHKMEVQNANLVLQIFNDHIVQALLTVGRNHCLPFFENVAKYVQTIYMWWTVMNVNSPSSGCQLNTSFATPLTNAFTDEKYKFLNNFYDWLELWDDMQDISGKLSSETFAGLKHTTHAVMEIANYCINELKMKYLLTGKFQTDNLQARFGQYKHLAGAQYNISLRQMFECEKKLNLLSVLKPSLPLYNQVIDLGKFAGTNWEGMENEHQLNLNKIFIDVTHDDTVSNQEFLPVITCLAGYCCYSVIKEIKCNFCKDFITCTDSEDAVLGNNNFIRGIDIKSLLYPEETVINIVMYNYIVVKKLTEHPSFNKSLNLKNLATAITLNALAEEDALLQYDTCDSGHDSEKVVIMLVWASTNALLNKFCSKEKKHNTHSKMLGKKKIKLEKA